MFTSSESEKSVRGKVTKKILKDKGFQDAVEKVQSTGSSAGGSANLNKKLQASKANQKRRGSAEHVGNVLRQVTKAFHYSSSDESSHSRTSTFSKASTSRVSKAQFSAVTENISSRNAYSALGTAQVLKAFRAIGGLDGVEEAELRLAFSKLRNAALRKEVDNKLSEYFMKYDIHGSGTLDILEFEQMIRSSALFEKAVYELLEIIMEAEENDAAHDAESGEEQRFEFLTAFIILANILIMAISIDNGPEWHGWQVVELCFTIIFAGEIGVRYRAAENTIRYLKSPMNVMDVIVTTSSAIDCVFTLFVSGAESWSLLSIFRVFRLIRLARLIKVISCCRELVILLQGLASSFRALMWSFALLGLLVFLWSIIVRNCIVLKWTEDDGSLANAFKNVPESMLMMFRCWALNAEGACQDENGVPLYSLFSSDLGWTLKITWVLCEAVVWLGILNVVASVFIVNAINIEKQVDEQLALSGRWQSRSSHLLKRLDKLLRVLTHPNRKQCTPKDRNVAKVASLIHEQYPDSAGKMPDMCKTLVEFAEDIQTSLSTYANAMTPYEADEVDACVSLHSLPSAKMYIVDSEERLMVSSNCSLGPSAQLNIGVTPAGAVEVEFVQESTELDLLLEEAKELQTFIETRIQAVARDTSMFKSAENSMFKSAENLTGGMFKSAENLMNAAHLMKSTSSSFDRGEGSVKVYCDELINPGPKGRERIVQKVEAKYTGRYERNRDYARLGLIYDSVEGLMKALQTFLSFSLTSSGLRVVCIENRFAEPSRLGWRDVQILLQVRLPSSGRLHIMEVQLMLRGLADVRNAAHSFYEKIRAVLPEDAVSVVIDQLTSNTTLDLDITKQEWLECLKNAEVDAILNELRIPNVVRKDAIDIVDADGSGSVSTAELREGLLLCCGDGAVSGGIVDCKLKVREIQQWLRNKIEPQMHVIQNMLLHINEDKTETRVLLRKLAGEKSAAKDKALTKGHMQDRSLARDQVSTNRQAQQESNHVPASGLNNTAVKHSSNVKHSEIL